MQGLMVVGFIVDEILRVGLKNDKVTRSSRVLHKPRRPGNSLSTTEGQACYFLNDHKIFPLKNVRNSFNFMLCLVEVPACFISGPATFNFRENTGQGQ